MLETECIGEDQIKLMVESTKPVVSCPECGHLSTQVHDLSQVQMVRDLAIAQRCCHLAYRARRFKCEPCQKTFVERVDWKRAGMSYTERYERHLYQRVRRESVRQVAQDEGLSEEATQAIFEYWAKKRSRAVVTQG